VHKNNIKNRATFNIEHLFVLGLDVPMWSFWGV